MTDQDFKKAMKRWAKRFNVSENNREVLESAALNYDEVMIKFFRIMHEEEASDELKLPALDGIDELTSEEFGRVLDEATRPFLPSRKKKSTEKAKAELWALQQSLERLSSDALMMLGLFDCDRGNNTFSKHIAIFELKQRLIKTCARAIAMPRKTGRTSPLGDELLILSCGCIFEGQLSKKPASTPDGMFVEYLSLVFDLHRKPLDAGTISKKVRLLRRSKKL